MRIKYLRCGICANMARYGEICHYCGAYRVVTHGRINFYNRSLIRMGRAIPMPEVNEFVLDRVIARCERQYQLENPVAPPKKRIDWRLAKALKAAGMPKEKIWETLNK